jgi:hypothetical protein
MLFTAKRKKMHSVLCTIDFTKAFECIPYIHILSALSTAGINGKQLEWFSSYLHGRTQRTIYFNALSPPIPVSSGVPQGSVLGPLLFNIFINNLFHLLPVDSFVAYADDVTLISSGETNSAANATLQSTLNMVNMWATTHGMSISIAKCFSMHIAPSTNMPRFCHLTIGNTVLPVVSSLRILGVTFTDSLTWSTQHAEVRRKIASMAGTLHRFGNTLNIDCRKKIANAFILPHLRYCLPIWGNTSSGFYTKMDTVLLRTARIILHDRKAEFNEKTFAITNINSFTYFLNIKNVCHIFNILSDETTETTEYYIGTHLANDGATHNTRGTVSRKFMPIRCKRSTDEHCFQIAATRIWNSLPREITILTNFNSFISNIQKFFLNKPK